MVICGATFLQLASYASTSAKFLCFLNHLTTPESGREPALVTCGHTAQTELHQLMILGVFLSRWPQSVCLTAIYHTESRKKHLQEFQCLIKEIINPDEYISNETVDTGAGWIRMQALSMGRTNVGMALYKHVFNSNQGRGG